MLRAPCAAEAPGGEEAGSLVLALEPDPHLGFFMEGLALRAPGSWAVKDA